MSTYTDEQITEANRQVPVLAKMIEILLSLRPVDRADACMAAHHAALHGIDTMIAYNYAVIGRASTESGS